MTGAAAAVPTLVLGCVQSVDCSAACAGGDWLVCALSGCSSDADCAELGRLCVVAPGASVGSCDDPSSGLCFGAEGCAPGRRCVAVQEDGIRHCVNPAANDRGPCNQDADCPGESCAHLGRSFLGVCSSGGAFALCFTASILIAVVSYHTYEQRFLRLNERWAGG